MSILALTGCPTPPTALTTPQQEGSTDAGAGSSGAGSTGPGAATTTTQTTQAVVLMDMSQTAGQKTQDEVKAGEHVTIKGTLEGTCTGTIRIDVIEENAQPQMGQRGGPLTTAEYAALGPFELFVPKGSTVALSALCDADGDKKITAGTDGISPPIKLGEAKENKSDVKLEISSIPQQNMQGGGMGGQGGGMGGQGGGMGGQGGGMNGQGGQGGGMGGGPMGGGGMGGMGGGMNGQGGMGGPMGPGGGGMGGQGGGMGGQGGGMGGQGGGQNGTGS